MDNEITSRLSPVKKTPRRGSTTLRVTVVTVLLILMLGSAVLAYGYMYFYTPIQQSLAKIVLPVSRSKEEPTPIPTPNDGAIMGRSWNILLLGSDSDSKYNFPVLFTQIMMVVHIDTVHNSVH